MKYKILRSMMNPGLLALLFLMIVTGSNAQNQAEQGTFQSLSQGRVAAANSALAVGLEQFYSSTGKYTLSADGIGSTSSSMAIRVNKPNAGATVQKAILLTSPIFNATTTNGCVTIAGAPVTWAGSASSGSFTSYWADVTSLVSAQINGLPAGISTLPITECSSGNIDGEALLVVFNDATATEKTIIIMVGAQNPTGDNFSVTLSQPIDPAQPSALLDMGLGIGYSFQGASQFSNVSVNGQRLTSSAGGQDDGQTANGSLITVGGIGDVNTNPANPLAAPTNPRSDDELYSILPFITNTTTSLTISTINPSLDDNIFLAYFALSGAAIIGEGILLSQTATSGNVGTQHTVKAAVLSSTGQPVANRQVTFTITSGPNAGGTFSTNTNASGEAFYTYTGSGGAGTDNIQACFTNSQSQVSCSNSLSFQWNAVATSNVYYSKPTGDLHNVLTWGLNPDGSGPNPSDFNDSIFQLANRPGVYTMTADWTVGGTINIPAASQLQINGSTLSEADLAGPGTLSGSPTSNLIVTGAAGGDAGALRFTGGSNMLNNLTLNRTGSGASATIGTALNLLNVLTLTNGTLNTGNLLTLKSTASSTARVAPVTGNISGTVTVERYIPARRAWRLLAAPVGGTSEAASGVSSLTHAQETTQGTLTTSGGDPRPLSFGTATFSLNAAHTAMTFTATITNIDVTGTQTADPNDNLTAAHIHVGALTGANAPVRWGFFGAPDNDVSPKNTVVTPFASGVGGTFTGTWDLPEGNGGTTLATNLPGIFAGLSYINFHTVQFGGGEIRGQINLNGIGTQTINQAWQEGATTFSANPNPAPGFGTHITQSASNGADGLDFNTAIAMSSLKRHQNSNNTWVPVLNTNTTPVSSNAWFIFVRGDRSINMGFNTVAPNNTTLRASGPLRTGDQTFGIAASGLTAIPNPYASPLNFASIATNNPNITNSFTVVDPKLGSTGAFVNVSFNGVSYDVTPAAVSPITELIQSGQGFLVQSAGVAGSITIRESDKSATAATNVFRSAGSPTTAPVYTDPSTGVGLRVNLQSVNDDQTTSLLDEVFSSYKHNYSEKLDNMDALKVANTDENLGVIREDQTLILERKPLPTEGDIIPLKVWNLAKKTYMLEINPINLFGTGLNAYLEDKYLKRFTTLSLDKTSQVYFNITGEIASAASDRFQIILSRKVLGELTVLGKGSITAFPNPISNRTISLLFNNKPAGNYQVTLRNSLGQTVFSKSIQHGGGSTTQTVPLDKKPVSGVYQLQVSDKQGMTNISIISN